MKCAIKKIIYDDFEAITMAEIRIADIFEKPAIQKSKQTLVHRTQLSINAEETYVE